MIAPIGYGTWKYLESPDLSEVSSDLASPPQWLVPPPGDRPADPEGAGDGVQAALQEEAYPGLAGRRYEGAIDRVLQAVRMAMADAGMKIVSETGAGGAAPSPKGPPPERAPSKPEAAAGSLPAIVPVPLDRPSPIVPDTGPAAPKVVRIQAIHRTPVFGLTSDVLIRLREDEETTVVDIRVSSRFGPRDLGTGEALAREFYRSLDRDLLGIAGGQGPASSGN